VTLRPALSRRALVAVLLAVTVALPGCAGKPPAAVGASSGGGSSTAAGSSAPAAKQITVTIAHGKASGDTGRITVAAGTPVTLVVTSDVPDQVHLHGYDIEKDLVPAKPTTLSFVADVPGVFDVELHEADIVILHLQVG
jgi:hypothetical protein